MFYRLFKLLTVTGLLFFAFTAKAGSGVVKTHVPGHIVKQHFHLHLENLAEETSLASILINEAPLTCFISHPAFVTDQLANLFSIPEAARSCNIILRNCQMPRRILLLLFPFHVFW
ncbi:hypothetical protein [Mucilaginibacter rubeus]|uniref:FAS1 domain-containing protein n=1 Tax=Mucilaginibacter rubeus TaxID=2027860 RepID=A0A5C1HTR0_9SPHI|nr:hypothetical protein [Mucilaginibacter rubeus]QEM09262.1 hypothetical protein DEO27_004270 [Mucilaginibacter rubeus]